MGFGGRGETHDELAVIDFVEGDIVMFLGVGLRVGAFDQGEAYSDLGAETNHGGVDVGVYQGSNGGVDVSRVGREEGAEKE